MKEIQNRDTREKNIDKRDINIDREIKREIKRDERNIKERYKIEKIDKDR